MKKLYSFFVLILLFVGINQMFAEDKTWTYTFKEADAADLIADNEITANGATWTFSGTVDRGTVVPPFGWKTDKESGLLIGVDHTAFFRPFEFTTDYFANAKVKSVTMRNYHICSTSSKNGVLTVKQDAITFPTCTIAHGKTWQTGTATGEGNGGKLTLNYSVAVAATAIQSITIVYEEMAQLPTQETMDAVFAAAKAAGATATDVQIAMNNYVITGVSSNNAYLTDGTKGVIIYNASHGFQVGDTLSGTVRCKAQLYNGNAELTMLSATTSGLTVKHGTVNPTEKTIAALDSINAGALVTIKNLTFNGTEFTDGTNTIKPYTSIFAGNYLEDNVYDMTGVFVMYNDVKQILPRSQEDIVMHRPTADLDTITVVGQTTSIWYDEPFVFGGKVVAKYADGSILNVTDSAVFSGYDMSTIAKQTVTVTYTEKGVTKTTTYALDVTKLPKNLGRIIDWFATFDTEQITKAAPGELYLEATLQNGVVVKVDNNKSTSTSAYVRQDELCLLPGYTYRVIAPKGYQVVRYSATGVKYGFDAISANTGEIKLSNSNKSMEWTGKIDTLIFTATKINSVGGKAYIEIAKAPLPYEMVEKTITLDGSTCGLTTTATAAEETHTYQDVDYLYGINCKAMTKSMIVRPQPNDYDATTEPISIGAMSYIYNKTPFQGAIKKFEVYTRAATGTFGVSFGDESFGVTGIPTMSHTFVPEARTADTRYDITEFIPEDAQYFVIQSLSSSTACGVKIRITYEVPADPAAPVFDPADGATFTETQTVTISGEKGAKILYSLDGTVPSIEYTEPIVLDYSATIRAIVVRGDVKGKEATATFTKMAAVEKALVIDNTNTGLATTAAQMPTNVTIDGKAYVWGPGAKNSGIFASASEVWGNEIPFMMGGGSYFYNVDAFSRIANLEVHTASATSGMTFDVRFSDQPITSYDPTAVDSTITQFTLGGVYEFKNVIPENAKYFWINVNGASTKNVSMKFRITYEAVAPAAPAAPVFTPATGATFTDKMNVGISTTEKGVKILYSLDGTEPSVEYTDSIELTTTTTIKAMAVYGDLKSDVASATFSKIRMQQFVIDQTNTLNLPAKISLGAVDVVETIEGIRFQFGPGTTNPAFAAGGATAWNTNGAIKFGLTSTFTNLDAIEGLANLEVNAATKNTTGFTVLFSDTPVTTYAEYEKRIAELNPDTFVVHEMALNEVINLSAVMPAGTKYFYLKPAGNMDVKFRITAASPVKEVVMPSFTPANGATFTTIQEVEIKAEEGAKILYSLDESAPSLVYTEPILLVTSTTITAVAIVGKDTSNVASATFTQLREKELIIDASNAGLTTNASEEPTQTTINNINYAFSAGVKVNNPGGMVLKGKNDISSSKSLVFGESMTLTNLNPYAGAIKKFEIYTDQGTLTTANFGVNFSAEPITAFDAEAANKYIPAAVTNDVLHTITGIDPAMRYFYFVSNGTTAVNAKFRITYEAAVPDPVRATTIIAPDTLNCYSEAQTISFEYKINHPAVGAQLTATTGESWINNFVVTGDTVTFNVDAYTRAFNPREGAITLKYPGAEDVVVTLVQSHEAAPVLPDAPTFTPAGGTFTTIQTVEIKAGEGATILYSVDESAPALVYTEPILLTTTTTITAVAVVNEVSSEVASATFTQLRQKELIIDASNSGLTTTASTAVVQNTINNITYAFSAGVNNRNASGFVLKATNDISNPQSITFAPGTATFYNVTPYQGVIKKFEVFVDNGTATTAGFGVNFSADPITAYDRQAAHTFIKDTAKNNMVYDLTDAMGEGARYFMFASTGTTALNVKFRITYEAAVLDPARSPSIIAPEKVECYKEAQTLSFEYTINHPADGAQLTATTSATWISNIVVTGDKVTFDVSLYNDKNATLTNAPRNAVLMLKYPGAEDVEVAVIQKIAATPTVLDMLESNDTCTKVMINGVIYIKRNNVLYDMQGQIVE